MMPIYIDIETIPAQAGWVRDELAFSVRPPGTYKKAETIATWERDDKPAAVEDAYLKTSFDGGTGQIVCVSWAVGDNDPQTLGAWEFGPAVDPASEREVLANWFDALRAQWSGTSGLRPVIVGHNVISFDVPFVWKRAVVHQMRPPLWWPRNPKPWSEAVFDTMTQWAGDRDRISLDKLCRVLGLEGKGDGPTGADVWPMVQDRRFDEIGAYCEEDVVRARSIYKKLNFIV